MKTYIRCGSLLPNYNIEKLYRTAVLNINEKLMDQNLMWVIIGHCKLNIFLAP